MSNGSHTTPAQLKTLFEKVVDQPVDVLKAYNICEIIGSPYPVTKESRARRIRWLETIMKNYGMAEDQFVELFELQGFKCAKCGTTEPTNRENNYTPWCVDHCHSTGEIRGILCQSCNYGIGLLGDSIAGLRQAVAYLESVGDRTKKINAEVKKPWKYRTENRGLGAPVGRGIIPSEAIDTSLMKDNAVFKETRT